MMTDQLAISFWIWALYNTSPNGFFDDLEGRMIELKERGFNCIRFDAGTGLCHDAQGRPRGELAFEELLPGGYGRLTRQMERFLPGRCDPLKRLIALCTLAQQYQVKVILTSWYYLHTFWFTDDALTAELFAISPAERFAHFARALNRILDELEQRGLRDVIAFAEVFNEADGLEFVSDYGERQLSDAEVATCRAWHEDALGFLRDRHPDIRFALDTCTAYVNPALIPRNPQVWNFHAYYLWSAYDVLEGGVTWDPAAPEPVVQESIRRFLRRDPVPYQVLRTSRGARRPIREDWYRRIWLYHNLDPTAMPELERILREQVEANRSAYRQRAEDHIAKAITMRDEHCPGVPLVLGEGVSYCADARLRWEERCDAYWDVVEHAARTCRIRGLWGTVPRTNCGPEDPTWHEYPERLKRVNEVFLGIQP